MIGCRTGIYDQAGIPDPFIWFDFTDLATINGGGASVGDPVSSIVDKVSGITATQGTVASQPHVVATGVSFDGTDELVVSLPAFTIFTLVLKYSITSTPAVGRAILGRATAPNHAANYHTPANVFFYVNATEYIYPFTATYPQDILSVARLSSVDLLLRLGGVNSTFAVTGTFGTTDLIGNHRPDGFDRFFLGIMKHIIFYDAALTDSQIASVEASL